MKKTFQIFVGVLALILFASELYAIAGVRRRTRRRTAVVVSSANASASASAAQQQQTAAAQQQTADAQAQTAAAQQQTAEAQAAPAPAPAPAPAGVKLPVGTVTSALPAGCVSSPINGVQYYFDGASYYRAVFQGNTLVYITAEPG